MKDVAEKSILEWRPGRQASAVPMPTGWVHFPPNWAPCLSNTSLCQVSQDVWPHEPWPLTDILQECPTVSATFDPSALHVFQALMILSPTGWMCMPLWDPTRSGLWSTWPQCSVCLPKKSWWSGPWLRYWLKICSKSKQYNFFSSFF